MADRDPLAEVLYAHRQDTYYGDLEGCACRQWKGSDEDEYHAHLADAVRAFLASDETVERVAAAFIAGLGGGDPALWKAEARAALAAATEVRP